MGNFIHLDIMKCCTILVIQIANTHPISSAYTQFKAENPFIISRKYLFACKRSNQKCLCICTIKLTFEEKKNEH